MRNGAKRAPEPDEWDQRTVGLGRGRLVQEAERFLDARRDNALGLAPARLLSRRRADAWVLFWCAARRVDDSVESRASHPSQWRQRLRSALDRNFAERCVHALLRHPVVREPARLRRLLAQGLHGLEDEERFVRPRSMAEYLELLSRKSVPAMRFLDQLLFPGESRRLVDEHARLFAVSTQLGDDCRDAHRDMALGRVFVTREELRHRSLTSFVRSELFAAGRAALCAQYLNEARAVSQQFENPENHERAEDLAALWGNAIESGQIRPTAETLRLVFPVVTARRSSASTRTVRARVRAAAPDANPWLGSDVKERAVA